MFTNQKIAVVWVTSVMVLFLLLWSGAALAGGGFAVPWWTVDGGGGLSQGGNFAVNGTVGQPDAGTQSSAQYTLYGGFWVVTAPEDTLFLPIVVR